MRTLLALLLLGAGLASIAANRRRGDADLPLAPSPNAAERLRGTHAHGAFGGLSAGTPGGERLFADQPDTDGRIDPGLPDFFRGA